MQSDTTEVLMPLMGEGITEATLVKWLRKPGDHVRPDEPLLEVSTDKVDTEIPAPAAGKLLEVYAKDGDVVPVNQVIALIASEGAVRSPVAATQAQVPPPPSVAAATPVREAVRQAPFARARSSPLVRKIAKAQQIDLTTVQGSGLHGRITKRDLEQTQQESTEQDPTGQDPMQQDQAQAAAPVQSLASNPLVPTPPLATKRSGELETLDGVVVRREKMSRMRSLIAEHMVRSVRTSPHVTTIFEIDMHKVSHVRTHAQHAFHSREGFKLTFTPFFLHAAVQALKRFPVVNCSIDGDDILWKDQINLGVAVALEQGLIVPVIRDAGSLNVTGLARRLQDLATRARTKKLVPEEVQGGTFSVTNPGMFGSLVSAPIINQPQVAILSIGAIIKRPVVIDDLIGIRPIVQVGLTFDHRAVDGEGGSRFLAFFKETLEGFTDSSL